ncbi:ABC-2 type transport system permease protein/teichoic acid transport system permease protein [Acetitomaculum ruminis DSM 5522]|uniref:Transport permease protein n=1 Tax=Acetitomaculum ruminis DSM 5522 TaxID=1120918 RepID=A0A1I0VN50_9FIRM|nr:ABC transporter permease [Acetitomaculum ruminis]SFA77423.1 ABC-2 type transport system permease protein/teichoic acid transport system permease protein [Acetitomaculum ruminis DSM 5522]
MKRFISDIQDNFKYLIYSAKSELKAEVANSYLNWIWWVLQPLCFMLIYTFMFSVVFNAREDYFPIFIFIGITMWDFFNKNITQSVKMIKRNKPIVTKVYVPKFILTISKMFVNGFKMAINFGIIVAMMIVFKVPVSINLLYLIPLMVTLWVITFGCMCIVMHFGVFIEDLSNVITIVFKMLFYMTGVFYDIHKRIGKSYPELANFMGNYNPMAYLVSSVRKCLIYTGEPDLKFLVMWFAIGIILSVIGVKIIYKYENGYAKVV